MEIGSQHDDPPSAEAPSAGIFALVSMNPQHSRTMARKSSRRPLGGDFQAQPEPSECSSRVLLDRRVTGIEVFRSPARKFERIRFLQRIDLMGAVMRFGEYRLSETAFGPFDADRGQQTSPKSPRKLGVFSHGTPAESAFATKGFSRRGLSSKLLHFASHQVVRRSDTL